MITYKNGDLLTSDCNIICHQVNCQGVMGSGIAKQIRETYPLVYKCYMSLYKNDRPKLGEIGICPLDNGRWVINMYSQNHFLPRGICHTDYYAFTKCIQQIKEVAVNRVARGDKIKIGFPYKIGCGLAGGDWSIVEKILTDTFLNENLEVEIWKML